MNTVHTPPAASPDATGGLRTLSPEALLRLVRASCDAVVLLDAALRVVDDGGPAGPGRPADPQTPWPAVFGSRAACVGAACAAALSGDTAAIDVPDASGRLWTLGFAALPQSAASGPALAVMLRTVASDVEAESRRATDEQRYRALIATSPSVAWRAGPDGGIVESWGWQNFAAQAEPGQLGAGWIEALHPEDRDRVARHWAEAVAVGELTPIDYRVRQADGTYHWARARAVALRDPTGAVSEWVGTVSDIHERRQAEQILREREELLRLAVGATGLGIWELDFVNGETRWSDHLKAIAGLDVDHPVDDDLFYALVHPDDRNAVRSKIDDAVAGLDETPWEITYRLTPHGSTDEHWVTEWGRLVLDVQGRPSRIVGTIADITARKRREIDQATNEKRWRQALVAGRMIAWEQDLATGAIRRSDNAVAILGESPEIAAFVERIHPTDRPRFVASIRQTAEGRPSVVRYRYRRGDGSELWLESSAMLIRSGDEPGSIVGVTADITDKVEGDARLQWAATHDSLTGLLNRDALREEIRRAIARSRRAGGSFSLMLVDLDHFKDVNDTLGHDAGDALLRQTAARLSQVLGEATPVARLGGDEFAALVPGDRLEHLDDLTAEIVRDLGKPFRYRGKSLSVRASIGIALYPAHDGDAVGLLKASDLALYAAKEAGRGRVRLFTEDMRRAVEDRIALTRAVGSAVAEGRMVPFYQPKVDLRTGAIVGFEALARWIHPERGVLGPAVFGAAFEDPELALAIEERILDHVTADAASWLAEGIDFGRIALNLSAFTFKTPGTAARLKAALAGRGIPARHLEVEVTETVLLDTRTELVEATLRELHAAGIKISLDDFGTGFASLTHLKRFPVDEIKIDRSFVRDLEVDADDAAIVSAVLALGRDLGLTVVAEGIETEGQASVLRAWGCEYGQGFLYAKPMAASRVPHAIAASRPDEPVAALLRG